MSSGCAPSTRTETLATPKQWLPWRAPKPTNSAPPPKLTPSGASRPSVRRRSRHASVQLRGSGDLTRSSGAHAATILAVTGQRAACNAVHSHSPALVPRSATEGRGARERQLVRNNVLSYYWMHGGE